ncbi:MAG TPA: TIGR01777 family oxidoreductase [Bryobacteraceae bacterium]|nr:TIGR01777 family oxidoreductase [Bryobacteraceae bacterium]
MRITLTGATGFIGQRVVQRLLLEGHALTLLSRRARPGENPRCFVCDLAVAEPPLEALEGANAVIHLAGEPVAQRWSEDVKRRIRASRVDGTRRLVSAIGRLERKPAVLISASAIGIYGDRGDEILTESSPPGRDFLAAVALDWEREAQRARRYGLRVVNPRIGIVLGKGGGALAKMLPAFRAGAGGRLGSGRQWMSWIHIEDAVSLILLAVSRQSLDGPVNVTAPHPVTNAAFTRALAQALGRPAVIPVPSLALRVLFGEMAGVLLGGARVLPQVALQAGYAFRFPELQPALEDILSP